MTSFTFNHTTLDEIGLAGVKAKFDLPIVIASLLDNSIKPTQSNYCQLEDDECPFCGHQGCFKIFHGDPDNQNYHCFSCGESGDIFNFLVAKELAKNGYDAANKLLNGEIDGASIVTTPRPKKAKPEQIMLTPEQYQRRQALLVAAWEYYFEQMIDGDALPLKQLMSKRQLSESTLVEHNVGYSRGDLWRYLAAQGFELQELYDSGLVVESLPAPRDYFPKNVYIFPHYDESGDICRFTFKDPTKEKQYQLPQRFWLNDIQFYGQNSMTREGTVAIVEGEHDLLALYEHGWEGPILATNGSIGQSQLDWIAEHLHDRYVVTFFDSDAAGEKYREKLQELGLPSLIQVTIPEGKGKDIDDYLRTEQHLSLTELIQQCGINCSCVAEDETSEESEVENEASEAKPVESIEPPTEVLSPIWQGFDEDTLNDVGNADRLKDLTKGILKFVPEFGGYYGYIDEKWHPTGGSELLSCRSVGEAILSQAQGLMAEALSKKDSAKLKQADTLQKFGRSTLNRKKIADMLELFKSWNSISANTFDADPMLLGVENGVLDLERGQLIQADKELYICRSSNVSFDATATCPRWLQFIQEITCGDAEFGEFLQRIVGYILTGRTDEQVLFFLHGHGCNGKSTFMNVIQRLMGNYYHQINNEVLLQSKGNNNGPNPSLAKLIGSRLVVANELAEGSRMDENLVKSMTGNDVIVARQLYAKEELEFRPMFKLIMVGNHKPVIRDTSTGMWRRMILLPFNASFSKEQLDPRLMDKLYAELPGILNWALEGVRQWLIRGIKASTPDSIKAEIDEYRHESDLLSMFLEECTSSGEYVFTDDLYDSFKKWAERDGDWKMTRNIMTKRLVEKGYEKTRKNSKVAIQGIRLTTAYESLPIDDADKPLVFLNNQASTVATQYVV
ncbi:phage/plasmid primase, P4 family [Shewanella sp. A3A]|nr:phage/plasmid primase, P4 family [Shewanella ferrihydritica]